MPLLVGNLLRHAARATPRRLAAGGDAGGSGTENVRTQRKVEAKLAAGGLDD